MGRMAPATSVKRIQMFLLIVFKLGILIGSRWLSVMVAERNGGWTCDGG
jgi:hypothetical protein